MAVGHAPGSAVVGVTVAFTILAFITTAFRLFTRIAIVKQPGIDDFIITIALIFTIALTACMVLQVKYGMGRHAASLSPNDNKYSLIWFWASVWIYYPALMFAKLSILFQYLRIFPDRRFRRWCWILMAVIVAWTGWAFFSALFACWPIQHFWDDSIPGACLNRLAVWFSNAAMNIVTDIATTVLPLPVLKSLNLPKRQRYILMVVFGMGGVVCIISIMRLSALYAISVSNDVSWDNPLAAIWSSLEVNVGIVCSCIPTLKGCITRYFPRLFSSVHGGSRPSGADFAGLELSGRGRKHHAECHISANHDVHRNNRDIEKSSTGSSSAAGSGGVGGKMKRMASKLGRGSNKSEKDIIEHHSSSTEDEDSLRGRLTPPDGRGGHHHHPHPQHGIHVTTIVEQEEERDSTSYSRRKLEETESVRGLVSERQQLGYYTAP
ncbi:hypothetical protein CB0940_09437 [Cercospora beticola]|uniref:Rhodopsin domain-containing protein n=1 Tax=Cercospora beticola TaxID=122368 RepID=A0A2G5HHZ1_CERBT|nr:hypothetical protein CB0940_09437 [Cercospora beticola]PIA92171.1 hypothetical protein CB0940_09437 [Cercospora beticola]WPB06247.1 hypothetical protein RHO25_010904 [Cercospora beticola]